MTQTADAAAPRATTRQAGGLTEKPTADAGFYLAMVVLSALIIVAGFAPSFYLKSIIHAPPPLTMLTVTHGVVFTVWLALFLTQATLVAGNNLALHRQLGMLGAVLFGAMITLGVSTAITAGRLGHHPPGSPPALAFMALPLFFFAVTTGLVAAALWLRRRSDWHKRLMLATLFSMTGPGTGRLVIPMGFAVQGVWISMIVSELLLAAAMAWDVRRNGRVHPAYMIAGVGFAAVHLGLVWAFSSPTWLAIARALTAG